MKTFRKFNKSSKCRSCYFVSYGFASVAVEIDIGMIAV